MQIPTEAARECPNVSSLLTSTVVIVYQTIRICIFDELAFQPIVTLRLLRVTFVGISPF